MPASEPKTSKPEKLPGIFISYRRSDSPDAVGRIYDRLVAEFGKARVFKDVDSIPLGQDFRGHLNSIVGGCAAVLAVIGPKWTDIRNEAGHKRLEDPDDFVRIELEAALARNVPVVPVLVGHSPMPGPSQLPSSLASLAFRQSIEVRPDPDFHNDATRLVVALRAIIDPNAPTAVTSIAVSAKSDRPLAWMIAFSAAALAAITLALPALKYLREVSAAETRIAIPLSVVENLGTFALSPDGLQIVYLAKGDSASRLWLRSFATMTAQALQGTESASAPFWSPDSRSIGFFAGGTLKRLDLGGGLPQNLAPVSVGNIPLAGAWGVNGDILFTSGPNKLVARIAATGGPVTEVTKLGAKDASQLPIGFLPDGQHFLFTAAGGKSDGTFLGALDGSPPVRLTTDVGPTGFLPSGWMLMQRLSGPPDTPAARIAPLVAQRLDVRNARLTGKPVTIANSVSGFSASTTGLVAYRLAQAAGQRQLAWLNRSGAVLGIIGDADGTLNRPRVAPDGNRVAVSRSTAGNEDVWILEGARASRVTSDPSVDTFPVWSPDGARIAFASTQSGKSNLHQRLANGAGADDLLLVADKQAYPLDWSSDGRYLLYVSADAKTLGDIWVLPLGNRKPFAFLRTRFNESRSKFSPDGRWVAYQSDVTGTNQVYVRPFARDPTQMDAGSSATGAQWLVSTAGGVDPVWRADGKELFFLNPAGEMMAAPIAVIGSAVAPGIPVKLFAAQVYGGGVAIQLGRQYDVAPDGRFLINRDLDVDATPTIVLIQNWNPDAKK